MHNTFSQQIFVNVATLLACVVVSCHEPAGCKAGSVVVAHHDAGKQRRYIHEKVA